MPQPVRGGGLSRDQVARAALELIDADGIDALSMRRLAAHLGVGTMTLYGYVSSKTELLEAAVDAAAAEFVPIEQDPPGSREHARANMLALRAWIKRHPGLIHLQGHDAFMRPSMAGVLRTAIDCLRGAGLPEEEMEYGVRLLISYVFGATAFDRDDNEASFLWGLERIIEGVEARVRELR